MADYVDKVKKNGKEYEIRDTEGRVKIEGTSLVIPEQEAPTPVITIDGVDYFHKQEFDLEEILNDPTIQANTYIDVLTGEMSERTNNVYLQKSMQSNWVIYIYAKHHYATAWGKLLVYADGTLGNYENTSFDLVDNLQQVTKFPEAYLPTCSAYYGYLSEDGKTFISYFNLKSDVDFYEIDSVRQDKSTIPLKDARLPEAKSADAGKVLKVANGGGYELGTAGGNNLPIKVIEFSLHSGNTFQNLAEALGFTVTAGSSGEALFLIDGQSTGKNVYYIFKYQYQQYGMTNFSVMEYGIGGMRKYYSQDKDAYITTNGQSSPFVPALPNDASTKTYVLKAVNGTIEWVEEV